MASPPLKQPVLQKPPGYRDPNTPHQPKPKPKPKPPLSRKPLLPLSLRSHKHRRRRYCRKCCCLLCAFLLVLLVLLIVASSFIYVVYNPQPPVFHLQSFRVSKLNVTEKADGDYLSAGIVARVEVKNPNTKIQWYFGETRVEISTDDGNVNLGEKVIPGFKIEAKDVMLLKAETSVRDEILRDDEGKNLKGKFRSREFVPSVEIRTKVGINVEKLKIGTVGITVVCGDVTLKKLQGGAMPKCTITLLRWIKIQ